MKFKRFTKEFLLLLAISLLFVACGGSSKQTEQGAINPESTPKNSQLGEILALESNEAKYQIHFIDVGQGDAILVFTPQTTLLVDAGPKNGVAAAYLTRLGVNHIDYVVATHPHADHIGGFVEVFQLFSVGELIDPGVVHSTLTYQKYLTMVDNLDIKFTLGTKGLKRELGKESFFEVLHPSNPSPRHLNGASVVLKLTLENVTVMLAADIEKPNEEELLRVNNNLRSTILKVAHHGSSTSSHLQFLEAVDPEVAVITCAPGNSYGFPAANVLEDLQEVGAKVYRTDLHGHVIIKTDGKHFIVETSEFIDI